MNNKIAYMKVSQSQARSLAALWRNNLPLDTLKIDHFADFPGDTLLAKKKLRMPKIKTEFLPTSFPGGEKIRDPGNETEFCFFVFFFCLFFSLKKKSFFAQNGS